MKSPSINALAAPRPPEHPPPRRLPLIATIAPVIASIVLFAVTRSAFTLVFAALGPVVAAASTLDAAIQSRRTARREKARFEIEAARVAEAIDAAHGEERSAASGAAGIRELLEQPATILLRWRGPFAQHTIVRLGTGSIPSSLNYDQTGGASEQTDAGVIATLIELRSRAAVLDDAPIVAELVTGIGIAGPPRLVASLARAIAAQLAATLSPREWTVSAVADGAASDEDWFAALPHAVHASSEPSESNEIQFIAADGRIRIVLAREVVDLPRELDEVIELSADGSARVGEAAFRPEFVACEEAIAAARSLAQIAARAQLASAAGRILPDSVELRAIDGDYDAPASLAAAVGVGIGGPVVLDLVADGPHAIVGGTTGSGKSELLLSWVLGIAASRSPSQVTFLFVDFKGGASFGSLLEVPHSVGVITDLDPEQALRAIASLTAELRYRERTLAGNGLRAIDGAEVAPFPRLVVVVDEYAVLVETFPALHSIFADIAARGRSLGIHLILCTQRPAGVVRDGILANCALRLSLRVPSAADSVAVLGTDAAASLPARPLGRALVSIGGGPPTEFQVALSDTADSRRVVERWRGSDRPRVPWQPPLPARVYLDALEPDGSGEGVVFALADLPAEQAQRPVSYRPREHGSLLVVGAAGSGKTGVLAALAAMQGDCDVTMVPTDLPSLWDFLTTVFARTPAGTDTRRRVVLLDDVDSAIARCQEAYQAPLVELLTRLLRDGPALGISCVLTAARVGGAVHGLASLCGSPLVLRMPGRAEHALAGGEALEFVRDLPPGAGHWRGTRLQIAIAPVPRVTPAEPDSLVIDVATARFAVASTRPEQFAALLRAQNANRRVVALAPLGFGAVSADPQVTRGDTPAIVVGDPDLWQAQWSLLATLQRSGDILFDGCSLSEVRALTRSRDLPPPFPSGDRPLWVRSPDGVINRATLPGV